MRGTGVLRFPHAMTLRTTLIAAAAALAVAAPNALADGSPPIKDGVKCSMKIKRTLPLAKVLRHGLPVKVTCDGAARFLVMPDFAAMSKASQEYDHLYGSHRPPIARSKHAKLTEAGTITLRPRFTKVGKTILRHHKSTRILTGLGTLREDGHYWSDPGDWAYTRLNR
jgi:hypothetical protein